MKIKDIKQIIKNYDDEDEVLLRLGLLTAYKIEKYIIKPVGEEVDNYRVVSSTKDKKTSALILFLENCPK